MTTQGLGSLRSVIATFALIVAGATLSESVGAAPIFDQTLVNTSATVNTNVGSLANCLAAEGCLGFGSTTPIPAVFAPLAYFLSPAQVAAITGTTVSGSFTVVASRDIGHKAGAAAVDYLVTTGDAGVALGNLFENSIDSCPAGERGTDYAIDLVCGANFHTDVQATDTLLLSNANLQAFAADGAITFTMDPTDSVGRLKFFSFRLQIEAAQNVPEPSTLALAALACLLLLHVRRSGLRG
jgi:hypothetical protein